MLTNPFSPIFGGNPNLFFGRKRILADFDYALRDKGSDMRALFVTGTRGSGKTALLEQLSKRALATGRRVVDLGPDGTIDTLVRSLVRHTSATRTVDPHISASILGVGGGVSGISQSKTTTYNATDLLTIFLEACSQEERGVLVTIDEVQKVSIDDLSAICNAFQMASRKGHDVMLAIAGLPYSYNEVIHHEGCTYMRRARHIDLGLFSKPETIDAFEKAFALIDGLTIGLSEIAQLTAASYGHPYAMQLLGYYLVLHADERTSATPYTVSAQDISTVIPLTVETYGRRALRPMLDELTASEVAYLRAMAGTLDERRIARTGSIARALGKSTKQLSRPRDKLLRVGIIIAPARGQLAFNIPYLASYVLEEPELEDSVRRALEWRL